MFFPANHSAIFSVKASAVLFTVTVCILFAVTTCVKYKHLIIKILSFTTSSQLTIDNALRFKFMSSYSRSRERPRNKFSK